MPRRISERPWDWFFVVVFIAFACSSFVIDTIPLVGGAPAIERLIAESYGDCDPMFLNAPPFLKVATTVSGIVWGPVYLYLAWGFLRGRNRIRVPALMYASALTLAMLMIIAEELWSTVPGWASPRPGKFLAYNLPYLIVPILTWIRMRHPFPFGGTDDAEHLLRLAARRR